MTVPTISNLPTVPATSDPNFETEAPALFNHIKNTFVSEMNSAISFINSSTFDATVEFKNANFTAARNFLYMIDTSSGGVSVTLPANPSTGDQLLLMDQKRTFGTNNLTIGRNSQNINGAASDVVSKSTGALIRCIFQASYGWTVDLYEGEWESGTSAGDLVYNGGNVGIGTSSPDASLHITKSGDAPAILRLERNDSSVNSGDVFGSIEFESNDASTGSSGVVGVINVMAENSAPDAAMRFLTSNNISGDKELTEKMRITSDGDIELSKLAGRSYSLPSVTSVNPNFVTGANFTSIPVQVGDEITFYNNQVRTVTAVTNTQLTVDQNWTTSFAATSATGKAGIGFNTKDTERMRITADGKVGIGTSAPDAQLTIAKDLGSNSIPALGDNPEQFAIGDSTNQGSISYGMMLGTLGSGKGYIQQQRFDDYSQAYDLLLNPNGGNVGIGTSAPNEKLTVEGDIEILNSTGGGTANLRIRGTGSNTTSAAIAEIKAVPEGTGAATSMTLHTRNSSGDINKHLTINSSGNVGIGTSSPNQLLTLGSSVASSTIGMDFETDNISRGSILYDAYAGNMNLTSGYSGYGGKFVFEANGAERMRIDTAGDVEVKTGNLVIGTAGKGIDFSANSHATGMTSELLDSYEEGTWTPVVADASSGGNTATGNFSGTYTKVGRVVNVHGYVINVNTTGLTSTNDLFIRGLPFNNRDTIARYGTVRVQAVNFSGYCVVQLGGNANFFTILENISGSTNDVITVADLTSGTADILFSLTYEA